MMLQKTKYQYLRVSQPQLVWDGLSKAASGTFAETYDARSVRTAVIA